MSMSTARAGRAAVAGLALALASPAAGSAGNGVRLGGSEGRLHPFLEVEDRYDSNVYYTTDKQSVGDMVLHVRPGFELTVPGELAAAELGGSLDWAQYLGLDKTETKTQLSKLYGQASLGLALNRRGVVGLEVDDEFRRAPGTTALVLTNAVVSNYNVLRVRAPFRPGGGALVFTANGAWLLETFESFFSDRICAACGGSAGDLGYNEFRAGGEAKWRFLPRTAGVFQAGWFSRVPNASGVSNVAGYEAQAGLTGLATPHLGATIKAGYSSTLGVTGGNLGTWLATVEGEWIATDSATVRLGYTHGLGVDPGPSLYTSNRVYAAGRILLAGRYALRLDGNYENRDYDRFALGSAPTSGSASTLRAEPAIEAGIARWMTASVGYAYSKRSSSFPAGTPQLPGFDYGKSEAWVRLAVRY
ncbi:MAG TPA: hypothetical protein VIW03_06830 [Anaeromyxobacter sp.]